MYNMTRYEFIQYKVAYDRLIQCRQENAEELQHAYDSIHPTRTQIDYQLGQIYIESIDPAEYAAYMIDLQAKHKQSESYWMKRFQAYSKALKTLTDDEAKEMNNRFPNKKVENKVIKALEKIIAADPSLQRNKSVINMLDDVAEYDKRIDEMSIEELLKD